MTEIATHIDKCSKCRGEILIDCIWEPGGMNDYGGSIIQCEACGTVGDIDIGRDVNVSRV